MCRFLHSRIFLVLAPIAPYLAFTLLERSIIDGITALIVLGWVFVLGYWMPLRHAKRK